MTEYSTQNISPHLIEELTQALKSVTSHGSVEVYVQDGFVTQITVRNIKKTNRVPLSVKKKIAVLD